MRITVNGEQRDLPDRATVHDLLQELGLGSQLVAVERNTQIVPRAEHDSTSLNEGDELEVVHFVGGG